jgi:hypothetical protein
VPDDFLLAVIKVMLLPLNELLLPRKLLLEIADPLAERVRVLAHMLKAVPERLVQIRNLVLNPFSEKPPHGKSQTRASIKSFPNLFFPCFGMVPGRSHDVPRTVLGMKQECSGSFYRRQNVALTFPVGTIWE